MRPFLALLLPLLALPAAATEIDPAERREEPSFSARIPPCHHQEVMTDIANDFRIRESRFWNSSLTIVRYERIREVAWRPWGLDTIPRRFCSATAIISDGVKRRIDYSVREDLGFAGVLWGWGTEWCVAGLDRDYSFAPHCRMAQP